MCYDKAMFILSCKNADESRAAELKQRLMVPLFSCVPEEKKQEPYLSLDEEGLSLCREDLKMVSSWEDRIPRLKQKNLEHELILKAVRIKEKQGLQVLDATAGLGEDSLILAASGYHVTMFESDPVIGALLEDAYLRALKTEGLREAASRMTLCLRDSIPAMEKAGGIYDVVLLDPMFPEKKKNSDVKKKFQLLHELERPCENEAELMLAAVAAQPKKIVVKRRVKDPVLGNFRPDYTLSGKAIRYDCYINLENRVWTVPT